jgi:fatty acid-binding protein DegV
MLDAVEKDLTQRFAGKEMYLDLAYTCSQEDALQWKREVEARFPGYEIHMDPLSLSVSCHIGFGAVAITCCHKVPELQ